MAIPKKRGDKYRVRVFVGADKHGKKIYRSVTANTKREAEKLAAQIRIEYEYREDITFGEAVERYINAKANTLSPSTIGGYETIQRNYIDKIKDLRLSRINSEDIQLQLDAIAENHSAKTVNNARALFVPVIKMFIPSMPLRLTTPAKEKKQRVIPTDEELQRLLENCQDPIMRLCMMLAAFCSLRESEVSGLMPDCVKEDYISIRRVMVQGPDNKWVMKDHPKSFAGYREIIPPPEVMELLKNQIRAKDEPIIPYTPQQIRARFETIRKKAGCEGITFHALRHYFATYCHSQNIPDKTIAKIGGWESIETLQRIYQHSTPQRENELSVLMAKHFKEMSGK